jgi:uncharacterized protein
VLALLIKYSLLLKGNKMKKFCTVLVGFLFLVLSAVNPALGNDLQIGLDAFRNNNYTLAYEKLKPFAEQGNKFAQAFIGDLYYDGNGVPQNCESAKHWYTEAAKQGLLYAQFQLGNANYMGECPQNYDEAFKWFAQAAEQNEITSQSMLGYMYNSGKGTSVVDHKKAFYWFSKAANQGDAKAQAFLGFYYTAGIGGVIQDYVQAYAWWNIAASQGNSTAKDDRNKIKKEMSPEQIAEAQSLSRQLYSKIYDKPNQE